MIRNENLENRSPDLPSTAGSSSISSAFPKIIAGLLWTIFLANLGSLIYFYPSIPEQFVAGVFKINGFSILIWTTVSFFAALVSSYAGNYLKGFKYHNRFMALCLAFTLSVMTFAISDHVFSLLISWLLMGFFMARLIGVDADWRDARESSRFAQKSFLIGTLFLSAGVLLLSFYSGFYTITALTGAYTEIPNYILIISALCIIVGAVVQSAIYPFHRWLLSAMTAPTPASALMHAGFVNGAAILLAFFASLLFATNTLDLLLIIGGLTAIIAQFTKLLQVNVKQKLACSTIAQMGFMIMQCGLGFFNAAVVHLILHGFYKAYLFLSSGEEVARSQPAKPLKLRIKPFQLLVVFLFGFFGAILFALLTGKGSQMDSGIFLTLIVAITVGQLTYNFIKQKGLSLLQKSIIPIVLFTLGIVIYALMYNGVTALMSDMPMVATAMPLSAMHIVFGGIFFVGFFIMKLGVYRKVPWLYVKLLNLSQPHKSSILMYKSTQR